MGAQETLFLGASHRNSEVSPPQKREKEKRGAPGDTHMSRGPLDLQKCGEPCQVLGHLGSPRLGSSPRTVFQRQKRPSQSAALRVLGLCAPPARGAGWNAGVRDTLAGVH